MILARERKGVKSEVGKAQTFYLATETHGKNEKIQNLKIFFLAADERRFSRIKAKTLFYGFSIGVYRRASAA